MPYRPIWQLFDVSTFVEMGLASKNDVIKVLGRGELNSKVTITAHAFSKSAIQKIEEKGGQANKI